MSEFKDRVRVAVVGVGALGRHHARILSKLPHVQLVGVSDANAQQAESVAEACGCSWTTQYADFFGKVDAVSIVVPTNLHHRIAKDFLSRGVPVLVEKPLTANVSEGADLVALAEEKKIPLQVGHIERFNPAFQLAKSKIAAPKYIRSERLSPYAFRSMDIGAVHDLMIHDLELVLSCVQEMPVHVQAFGLSLVGGKEDTVQARLQFPGGCVADLTANRVSPAISRTFSCWSADGLVQADLQARTVRSFSPNHALLNGELPYELAMSRKESIETLKPEIFTRFIQQETQQASDADALTAELDSFIQCVVKKETPVVCGKQALNALIVADQVLQSVAAHAWDGTKGQQVGPNALIQHYATQPPATKAA